MVGAVPSVEGCRARGSSSSLSWLLESSGSIGRSLCDGSACAVIKPASWVPLRGPGGMAAPPRGRVRTNEPALEPLAPASAMSATALPPLPDPSSMRIGAAPTKLSSDGRSDA